jgi:hypothetical protein
MNISVQTDGFSCDLLERDGLSHFYMPEKYLLVDVAKVDVELVKVLLKVVQCHLDQADMSLIALNNWSC